MKFLNILSSHYEGSFAAELLSRFNEELQRLGHTYQVIDLYRERFNPVMHGADFDQFRGGQAPDDIRAYQECILDCDVLTFFYPVWWNDMPAIMKGFIDRVFSKGFAYDYDRNGSWGMLKTRKVLLVCTLGNKKSDTAPELEEAMRIKEKQGVFGFCGAGQVEHLFLYNPESSQETKEEAIQRVVAVIRGL